ncbi:uncharacterized protein [Pagrus major]|uniref:uncharacterized protein n=1 Tax=Pagrus major TaxID=143350 RepID=UPI003CC851A4
MPRRNNFSFKTVLLLFLLIFGLCWRRCDSQVNRGEANKPPDGGGGGGGGDDGPFFALRSCHQLLHGDAGEFFSPDYLCSSPPLWCNWTVQVDPGKRVHLHLEDLTPDEACHLKQDQLHVDEPAGHFVGHKVLQKCWREAKFTSSSNTLYVVLLIGGRPSPPYRGFIAHYQAFGPPVVYNPQDGFSKSEPSLAFSEYGPELNGDQVESDLQQQHSDLMYDYYDQHPVLTAEPEEDTHTEVDENLHPASENYSQVLLPTAAPTVPTSSQETPRSGRGATQTPSGPSDPAVHPASPQQQHDGQNQELRPSSTRTPTAAQRAEEEAAAPEDESSTQGLMEEAGGNRTEVSEDSDQLPPPSKGPEPEPEPEQAEQTHPHPNMVEPLSDHRGNFDIRNHSDSPHLPGDHLFEVAVEVNFHQDLEESWDDLSKALLLSVKALISEELEGLHTTLSLSSKRIKRLHVGVLYILWLHIGQGPRSPQLLRAVHSALQGLLAKRVGVRGNPRKGVVISMSTADVNECGTQLVLCDINADCVDHYGSYSCRCRPGFRDESRLGSGGTVCVDVTAAGCSSGLSAETRGVYVLFFLLSSLILMLLAAAGLLYHRHHRGAFLVRCHSHSSVSPPDPNNHHHHRRHHHDDGYSSPPDSDLPPPPPPVRGFREAWPQVKERCPVVDLPLLRFSPLLPPDVHVQPQEGVKM